MLGQMTPPGPPVTEDDPRETVLIVGADAASRELMAYLLESRGYRVTWSSDEDAAAAASREAPDLVLRVTDRPGTAMDMGVSAHLISRPIDPSTFVAEVELLLKRR